jgi:beta-lactam-binding protein with PASTA domain
MNVQAAWISLKNKGLYFTIADSVESLLYPPNTVIQSSPSAGEKAEKLSKIKLIISKSQVNTPPDTTNIISDFEY